MAAPVAISDRRLGVKYGYTVNNTPATMWGHRCCFFPYTKSTNPMPPGINETRSQVGSNKAFYLYFCVLSERCVKRGDLNF
jgi:hypothetical protein